MVASMFTAASDALAAAVVELRKRAGFTQRQLADAVGREQSFIGRIETRQRRSIWWNGSRSAERAGWIPRRRSRGWCGRSRT